MQRQDIDRRDALRIGATGAALFAAAAMGGAQPGMAESQESSAEEAPEAPDATFGDVDAFEANLQAAGCTVQRGELRLLDTLQLASEGMLVSCFGNNAGSHYLVNFLPPAPGQDPAPAVEERGWPAEEPPAGYDPTVDNCPANPYFSPVGWSYKLRADEAVVMAGPMPPACVYFSLINYILLAADKPGRDYSGAKGYFAVDDGQGGTYHPVFGSIGMPYNQYGMATEATPGACPGPLTGEGDAASFGARFVYVVTGDAGTLETVRAALGAAGFGQGIVNEALLPAKSLNMGLGAGKDTFCTLGRISQPADSDAMDAWIASLAQEMRVVRVTPSEPGTSTLAASPIATRGTGVHEIAALPRAAADLDAIREALIAQYADGYDYEEPRVDIAVPEGMTGYLDDCNSQGDNHDTTYLMTSDFTLDSDEDFVVAYGVNHTFTGKAVYSNAVLYSRPMLNGVCSVYDGLFEGSAAQYMPEGQDPAGYYVYKLARPGWSGADEFTAEIPFSTGNEQGMYYGVDNGNPVLAAFRAYIERETGVGASYYEIVYDRAIVFHRRG